MVQLEDTVVVITGGTRGIGEATARLLADQGALVYACGRSPESVQSLQEMSDSIEASRVDIRDEDAVEAWMESIEEEAGRIDVLINNAGVLGPRAALDETGVGDWRKTIDINVNGTFLVTQRAYPPLRESTRPMIINLSSSVGRRGRGRWGAYSVSKFAVEGLAEVAADELGDEACVVTLNPGGTATDMRAEAYPDEDPDSLPEPSDVAQTIGLLATRLTPNQNGLKYSSRDLFEVVDDDIDAGELPTA